MCIFTDSPKIRPWPQEEEPYSEGSHFKAICALKSGSKPNFFTWTKDGHGLSHHQTRIDIKTDESVDISILSINNARLEDAGNYTCTARNQFGSDSYTIMLNINIPPKWVNEPTNVSAKIGTNVEILCDADGLPPPRILWHKLGSQAFNENNDVYGKILKIPKISVTDAGKYECVVYDNKKVDLLRKIITVKIIGNIFMSLMSFNDIIIKRKIYMYFMVIYMV